MDDARIAQEILQDRLVVPAQADGMPMHKTLAQNVDDALRIAAAIDVVANIDLDGVLDRSPAQVFVNALDQVAQEIGTSVNISDGVDACRPRNLRSARG